MQSSLADMAVALGENLAPQQRLKLRAAMGCAAVVLRKLREKKRRRDWLQKHSDRIPSYGRRYYAKHYEEIQVRRSAPEAKQKKAALSKSYQSTQDYKERRAARYAENPEPVRAKVRAYNKTPRGRATASERQKKKRSTFHGHFINWLRGVINRALRRSSAAKSDRTLELLGCTPLELRAWITAQFKPGMSWNNRTAFHIDHKRPLASFDLRDPDQQRAAFHFTNLQPLWASENRSKGAKYFPPQP